MVQSFNVRQTDIAVRIKSLYELNGIIPQTIPLTNYTSSTIEQVVSEGDLGKMLHLNFVANVTGNHGHVEVADKMRTLNYKCQMDNLIKHIGDSITIHTAMPLSSPSAGKDVKLLEVKPFSHIETNLLIEPFINYDGMAICAIMTLEGKALYVNPQIFVRKLVDEFNSDREGLDNLHPLLVKKYDWLLRETFGNENINQTRPWLRYGRLIKDEFKDK
jgi:hypothetical protein